MAGGAQVTAEAARMWESALPVPPQHPSGCLPTARWQSLGAVSRSRRRGRDLLAGCPRPWWLPHGRALCGPGLCGISCSHLTPALEESLDARSGDAGDTCFIALPREWWLPMVATSPLERAGLLLPTRHFCENALGHLLSVRVDSGRFCSIIVDNPALSLVWDSRSPSMPGPVSLAVPCVPRASAAFWPVQCAKQMWVCPPRNWSFLSGAWVILWGEV